MNIGQLYPPGSPSSLIPPASHSCSVMNFSIFFLYVLSTWMNGELAILNAV